MIGTIIGVGVIAAVFLFIAFKLDDEHGLLRFAFILFVMGLLFIIPAAVVQNEEVCELVINESEEYYQYGNNFTSNHWDTYSTPPFADSPTFNPSDDVAFLFHKFTYNTFDVECYNVTGTGSTFVRAVKYPYWLFIAYMIVYLFYRAALALGAATSGGRLSRFFKGFKR